MKHRLYFDLPLEAASLFISLRSPASCLLPLQVSHALPRFLVWVGVRDPSCATNVTLRHHECDSRRDPTRAGASVRAPSLTRMGSRACYRGWRFKQGPLDLSWGNGETGNGSRTRRCDALHHDLAVAPRGRVCCWQTQQSRRAVPPSLWNRLLPGTFYQERQVATGSHCTDHIQSLARFPCSLQLHSLPAAPSHRLLSPALVAFCRDEPLLGQTGPV